MIGTTAGEFKAGEPKPQYHNYMKSFKERFVDSVLGLLILKKLHFAKIIAITSCISVPQISICVKLMKQRP